MTTVTTAGVFYNRSGKTIQSLDVVTNDPPLTPAFPSGETVLLVRTDTNVASNSGVQMPSGNEVGDTLVVVHAGKTGTPGQVGGTFDLLPPTGETLNSYSVWTIMPTEVLTFTKVAATEWQLTSR